MYAVEMNNVTKIFGTFKANDNINLQVKRGEVHALLGENGAGKSTLMNLLFGFYELDGGEIKINGEAVKITDPNVANKLGIGMVHQHFKLVKPFTVAENITLGSELTSKFGVLNKREANRKVQAIIDEYDFKIEATDKIYDLTVGQQQKVEILKMLYKKAEIMIFDEPTGALTPQETVELLSIIKNLRKAGKTIILITHKLNEIKAIADRVTVIRRGKSIDTVDVSTTDEATLASLMVGRSIKFDVDKTEFNPGNTILDVKKINMFNKIGSKVINDISFQINEGEILGVAGVDGNGQTELVEGITGLSKFSSGEVLFTNTDGKTVDLTKLNVREINNLGVGHIPQDRHRYGLVLDFSVADNAALKRYHKEPYSKSGILQQKIINTYGEKLMNENDVRTPHGSSSVARELSGGNQQKLIIAREIYENPKLLVAVQPTRGVDIGAIENIHNQLLEQRDKNKAIMLVSLELEEVMKLSDRIAVLHDGELMGIVDAKTATQEQIGLMMAGKRDNEK